MKNSPFLASLLVALLVPAGTLFAAKSDVPRPKALAKYDTNKNGKLDTDEYEEIRKDFLAKPTGELAKADTDKDGKLSDGEIAALKFEAGKKIKSDADKAERRAKRSEMKKNTGEKPAI